MKLRLTALLAAGFVAGTVPSTAQTFSIKDLGAVAGDSVSKGYSLNDLGQAAGSSSNPSGAIPTLFSGGKAINLGTLVAGDVAVATGIKEAAEVVGYEFEYSNGGDGLSHGGLYSNGALLDLHSPSLFPCPYYCLLDGVIEVLLAHAPDHRFNGPRGPISQVELQDEAKSVCRPAVLFTSSTVHQALNARHNRLVYLGVRLAQASRDARIGSKQDFEPRRRVESIVSTLFKSVAEPLGRFLDPLWEEGRLLGVGAQNAQHPSG